ncbi:MAG: hypothetical protein ACW98Y_12860 [Candidatus Thorarchaeota archaeon]|jgi:hypothetical protein
MMRLEDFKEDKRYKYAEMAVAAGYGARPGGNFERGIVLAPKEKPRAILIKMNLSKGLYPDSYNENQDYFYYIGDGLPDKGHQRLIYGNKIMIEYQHLPVFLFLRYEHEKKGDPWTFKGRWRITGVERDYITANEIPNGEKQRVFRFKLSKSDSLFNEKGIFDDYVELSGFLAEECYLRATPAVLRIIEPKHKMLANQFTKWLTNHGFEQVAIEQNQIDLTFSYETREYMSELKVVYDLSSTKSIREAIGQVFEYNFFEDRNPFDEWLILLDTVPKDRDLSYIRRLTENLNLPLNLGWKSGRNFEFQRSLT